MRVMRVMRARSDTAGASLVASAAIRVRMSTPAGSPDRPTGSTVLAATVPRTELPLEGSTSSTTVRAEGVRSGVRPAAEVARRVPGQGLQPPMGGALPAVGADGREAESSGGVSRNSRMANPASTTTTIHTTTAAVG